MNTFVHESEEDLLELNNALLDLERDPASSEAIETVFRVAHNLKGNFGVMGFSRAGDLAHAMEDLLDRIRDGSLAVTADRMDLIFEGVDHLEVMVGEIAETGETRTDPSATIDAIRRSIDAGESPAVGAATGDEGTDDGDSDGGARSLSSDRSVPYATLAETVDEEIDLEEDANVYRVTIGLGDSASARVDAMFVLDAMSDEHDLIHTVPERDAIEDADADEDGVFDGEFDGYVLVDGEGRDEVEAFYRDNRYVDDCSIEDVTERLASTRSDDDGDGLGGVHRSKEVESIRVDVEQIDQLYNQVEEMVTSRIKLRKIIEGSDLVEAEEELEEHGKITESLQDTVLEIRLVPLQKIVGNFPRVVRDLARRQEKEIDFRMEGVDIEMDRSILNELSDPLMHIIRNAVDHGIEPPAERVEKGKPREGTITLTGDRERDHVSVTVEDDGRGLDLEAIEEKAVEKGIHTQEEINLLDDSEVYDLIFHPGFSTRDEVTEVSGRGVGMDVVNQVVRGVDGSINVESAPDEGTSVTLTLPVSVAIVRVLFVTVEGEMYGVPIKNIDEISAFEDVNDQTVEGQEVVRHDDRVYPLVSLGESLDVPGTTASDDDMVVRIKEDVRQICIRCDDVVGQEEVVIKPFEGILSGAPGISGASVLGEGEVVMILDVETL